MNDAERLELPHIFGEYDVPESFNEVRGAGGYYDRSGNPISFRDWARLSIWDEQKNEFKYKRVAEDTVGDYWISTVWLGLDHSFGRELPLIFETMVFLRPQNPDDLRSHESDLDCERYSTEQQALEGHKRMVEKVRLFVAATEKGEA